MNIAICLSGLTRNFENYLPQIIEFAEKWNADIFVHTWRQKDSDSSLELTDQEIGYIHEKLRPTAMDIESPDKFKVEFSRFDKWDAKREDPWSKRASNYAYLWYSVFQSNVLRRQWQAATRTTYDLVFRQRFDMVLTEDLSFEELDMDAINVMPINRLDGYADIWAAGNNKNMSIYSNIINVFDECCEKIDLLRPEDILKVHLDSNMVRVKVIDKKYKIK